MKAIFQNIRTLSTCLLILTINVFSLHAGSDEGDKTLSPYFKVFSDHPGADQLPLKETYADVNIAGVIADVKVTQVYSNTGKNSLEAIYVFPASSKAAIYGLTMTIGDRTIDAKIKKKEEARREYEEAREAGKRTTLLEQNRPNVFTMNVANIMPGDIIKVELKYTELLVPLEGIYAFNYPTVVGPRYVNKSAIADAEDPFTNTPYLKKGNEAPYKFDINIVVSAGMPIQSINCNSHKTKISHPTLNSAQIELDATESNGGNRDYVLNYRLAGGKIESGMLLYEQGNEKFFLAMVQPPKIVLPTNIPAREYIFIVDVSGSMRGFPLDISKKLLRNLISELRPTDKFNVMLFAGTAGAMSEYSIPATEENIERALNTIDNQRGGGSTRLLPALQSVFDLPETPGLSRSMVIVTDGYISVEKEAFDLIRENLDEANLFPFGIGSGVNRFLIEGMAHVGKSEALVITSENGATEAAEKFRKYINSPVLTQVKAKYAGFDVYDIEPISIPDVLAERPVIIYGKYRGNATGTIKIEGYTGKHKYKTELKVSEYRPAKMNEALRYLWARERIKTLDDYSKLGETPEIKAEVTRLGLEYNLMTAYTSFIAVDEIVVNKNGKLTKIKQPLPLPIGVENTAVGFDMGIDEVVSFSKKKITNEHKKHIAKRKIPSLEMRIALGIQFKLKKNEKCMKLLKDVGLNVKELEYNISLKADGSVLRIEILNKQIRKAQCEILEQAIREMKLYGFPEEKYTI